MARRFYLFENHLFNYDGSLSRLKNFEIKQGKTRSSVYSIAKNGKKKFLGYISKMPEKFRKSSEKKIKEQFKRRLKQHGEKIREQLQAKRKPKSGLSRESVYRIGQSLRDSEYFIDIDNTEKPIISQNLQSAINFDWILRHLSKDGLLTPEKIREIMDDDYNFTTVSRYERDLFNAYIDGDSETKSRLWD